ncbi:MAG: NADH-quinone oxidoreductase subunit H, partial [Chthoniobacterales bacterium]|nr:NADH-quinone oxidoreductase subunit H [Chthoniobacterales bacterium]
LNLQEIVRWQVHNGWLIAPFWPKGFNLHSFLANPLEHLIQIFASGFSLERLLLWIPLFLSFLVFLVSIFAETNRAPFDLPEAEQELVGGYHTEYSSMGFALFFLGEYAAMIAAAGVLVTLYLGGWSLPLIPDGSATSFLGLPFIPPWLASTLWGLINIGVFFAKVILVLLFMIWVRWTVPRFRFDQLMKLGWYVFFELALLNIILVAAILAFFPNVK